MTVFEDVDKDQAFELWLTGYKMGRGVEELDDLAKRTARERFERYLSREYE
jgi:hypothetical protein